jgi:polyisoprenoid-binding protein YceI
MNLRPSALLIAFLAAAPAQAQPETYEFDPLHTQILFFADHLGYSRSMGRFHRFDGWFTFDLSDFSAGSVAIQIQTDSLEMGDAEWNRHMKNADFFNVPEFPLMRYDSRKVTPDGDRNLVIEGELTLLGKTRPVTIHARFNKTGVHPKTRHRVAGFSGTATLRRSEFGMTYGLPFVGDEVEIRFEVEGLRKGDAAQ